MDDFEVGDIVGYKSGYYRILKKETETRNNTKYVLYTIEMALHRDGTPSKGGGKVIKTYYYSLSKITKELVEKWKEEDLKRWDNLIKVLTTDLQDLKEEEEKEVPEPAILTFLGPPSKLLEKKQ